MGEVVILFLEVKGVLGIVQCMLICLFLVQNGLIIDVECGVIIVNFLMGLKYGKMLDCEFVYELLVKCVDVVVVQVVKVEVLVQDDDLFVILCEYVCGRCYDVGIQICDLVFVLWEKIMCWVLSSDSIVIVFGKSLVWQIGIKIGQVLVRGVFGLFLWGK